jgi:hypothetical protein
MAARQLEIRGDLESACADVFTAEAVAALEALAGLAESERFTSRFVPVARHLDQSCTSRPATAL